MRASRRAGFTLVEVLVALVILSTIALLAWRGIDGMLRSREISQASLVRSERLQTVLAQWELDLRSLQSGGAGLDALSFDGASLRLTRRQREGLQVVTWTLRERQLLRWESPPVTSLAELDAALQRSRQGLAQAGRQVAVLEGLSGWQMYFYRDNAWTNAQSSGDLVEPPAPVGPAASDALPRATRLPSGVRMVLQFAPDSGLGDTLTRQIALEPQS